MRPLITILILILTTTIFNGKETKKQNIDISRMKAIDINAIYYDLYRIYMGTMDSVNSASYYGEKISYEWRKGKKRDERYLENMSKDSIETIFTLNLKPTESELSSIVGDHYENEKEYNYWYSQDVAYYHLSLLYKFRLDNKKSDEYWNKIYAGLRETLLFIDQGEIRIPQIILEYFPETKISLRLAFGYIILPSTIDKLDNSEISSYETIYDHKPTNEELESVTGKEWPKKRYLLKYYKDKYAKDIFLHNIRVLYRERASKGLNRATLKHLGLIGEDTGCIIPAEEESQGNVIIPKSYYKNMEISDRYYDMISSEYREILHKRWVRWDLAHSNYNSPEAIQAKQEFRDMYNGRFVDY